MEVNSLREPKMADRVAAVLRRMFVRGEIPEGTMLPPESELMERFGVSRPTLREAFRVLESESLIQVHRGVRGGAQAGDAGALRWPHARVRRRDAQGRLRCAGGPGDAYGGSAGEGPRSRRHRP